ncbi:hypothetical protein HJB84_25640 [Rhizobium sp. NZLR1b]|nr:hypothetical protein [Rhizobium sp. NZLR1b]
MLSGSGHLEEKWALSCDKHNGFPIRTGSDDYACVEYLAMKRWKDGIRCPRCGGEPRLAT